jgi:hypothetical protein
MGHEGRDRVVAEDGDAVVGARCELKQPCGRPLDLVGEPGPGQRTPVVDQGRLVGCLVGTAVDGWKGHGSSDGSSVRPAASREGDAETVAFIKKVRNTLIPVGSNRL